MKMFTILAVVLILILLTAYSINQWRVAQRNFEMAQKEKEKAIKAMEVVKKSKRVAIERSVLMKKFIRNLLYNLSKERMDINKTAKAIASASVYSDNDKFYIAKFLIDESKAIDTYEQKTTWRHLLHLMTEEQIKTLLQILYREQLKLNLIEVKYAYKRAMIRKYYFSRWAIKYNLSKLPKILKVSNEILEEYLKILKYKKNNDDKSKLIDSKYFYKVRNISFKERKYNKALKYQIF